MQSLYYAYRLAAVYLVFWCLLPIINPEYLALMYGVELSTGVRKLMTNLSFMWAVLAAFSWSLPHLGTRDLLVTYGRFAALFWLVGAGANALSVIVTDVEATTLISMRLVVEPLLGLAFIFATKRSRRHV